MKNFNELTVTTPNQLNHHPYVDRLQESSLDRWVLNAANNNPTSMLNLDEFLEQVEKQDLKVKSKLDEPLVRVDFSATDIALATSPNSMYNFDPSNVRFNEEELKPQPIQPKSRKQFVPDTLKDGRYWARRAKNNVAAKRSREARRLKENQIFLRANYLEKENSALKETIDKLTLENSRLKEMLGQPTVNPSQQQLNSQQIKQ